MKKKAPVLTDCLKRNRSGLIAAVVLLTVNYSVFSLYDLMMEPLMYAAVMGLVLCLLLFAADYLRARKRCRAWQTALAAQDPGLLPEADSLSVEMCRELYLKTAARLEATEAAHQEEQQNTLDYITAWVHQIKMPIAVMKLQLTEEDRTLQAELFRIEQYVDMVLQYIRLGSGTNDLLIREYELDELIRESIRKYAAQFVGKRLKLSYEPADRTIVTDRKWFCCILEQFISNAIKYTPAGTITISAAGGRLTVADTGIGIQPEDLPRIFEKGYTGVNGRLGQQSSGLGLYLAKKAAGLLCLSIGAENVPGGGSRFYIVLPDEKLI